MTEIPREGERRTTFKAGLRHARDTVWSWLTDPAVLLYRREAKGRKRARVTIVEFFLFIREVAREFYNIEGTSRASALAYTTLLSLIPLLVAFTQALQRYFRNLFPNSQAQIDDILNTIMPYQSPVISFHISRFVENAQTASAFGVIIFFVIAFQLFLAVESTVNQIWKTRSVRGYRQKIIAFTMLFFWGPVLMGISFTTTSLLEKNRYLQVLFQQDIIFRIVPIIVLFIAFTMLFWLVPSTRVRFRSAAVGALVTTSLFTLVRFGFGIYADYLFHGRFNVIYGALGLGLIFLIAIQILWVVILLGVEISYVFQNFYGILCATEHQVQDDPRFDAYFALRSLIEIARRFDRREEAPSSDKLAEKFGTTDAQVTRVLRKLEDAQLVKETGGDWPGFVPGCDPFRITVEEVVAQAEGLHRDVPEISTDDYERPVISDLLTRFGACMNNALDHLTIGQLVRQLYGERPSDAT
jgi:membrane protein